MPLNANALASLEDTLSYLKMTSEMDEVELIETLINAASSQIEGFCRRNLKEREYIDEEYDGSDSQKLLLSQFPVTQITSIKIDDVLINETEYKIRKEIGSLIRLNSTWPSGIMNIKVSYIAGYSEVPADIQLACKHLVKFYYSTDISSFSKTFGEGFVLRPEAIPGQIKMLLSPYRKVLV